MPSTLSSEMTETTCLRSACLLVLYAVAEDLFQLMSFTPACWKSTDTLPKFGTARQLAIYLKASSDEER